jgi:hypothetical protein
MDGQIRLKVWRVILVLALMIGLGLPAMSASAQQPRTPRAATPVGATPAVGGAVTPLSTATVMPGDTPVYFAVNLDTDSAQLKKAEELVRRAGLGDLLDQAMAGAESELQTDTNMTVDLDAFLGGEVGMAITNLAAIAGSEMGTAGWAPYPLGSPTPTAVTGAGSGIAVVVRAGDPDRAENVARQLIEQQALDFGGTVTTTDHKGIMISSAMPSGDPLGGTSYARVGDFLVFGATAADLEPVIDVAQGSAPSLADQAPFTRVRNELSSNFLVYSYTNGPAYIATMQADLQAAAAQLGPDFPYGAAFAQLNTYMGEVVWADDPGFRTDTISIPAAGALPPAPANFDPALDARVPDDTLIFADSFDLGPSLGPSLDVLDSVIRAAVAADPDLAQELPADALEGITSDGIYAFIGRFLAFNPRTALLDQLVGEWAFALSVRSLDPNGVAGVFVSGAKDELVLNDAVTKLAVWLNLLALGGIASESGNDAIFADQTSGAHTEEVNGTLTQVIEIPIPEMDTSLRLQWGVVKGQLVFGVGDGFTSYVNGPVATLADSPRYRSVMAELPTEHNGVFYLNLAEMINLVQPLVQQEIDAEQGGATPGTTLPDLSGIQSFGMVSFERDGMRGTSALLMIAKPTM